MFALLIFPILALLSLAFDHFEVSRLRHRLQTVADNVATATASLGPERSEHARRQEGVALLRRSLGATSIPFSDVGATFDFKARDGHYESTVTLDAAARLTFNFLHRAPASVRVRGRGVDRTAAMQRLATACHDFENMSKDERGQCALLMQ